MLVVKMHCYSSTVNSEVDLGSIRSLCGRNLMSIKNEDMSFNYLGSNPCCMLTQRFNVIRQQINFLPRLENLMSYRQFCSLLKYVTIDVVCILML